MCNLLTVMVVLFISAVSAQNENCQNGGLATGNSQAPCYCAPLFYGKNCEYSINITSATTPPNYPTTTSSSIFNASTTAPPSNNSNQCLNGGIQSGNFCYCLAPYYGDRCQYGGNSTVLPSTTGFQTTTRNISFSTTSYPIFNASTTAPTSNNSNQCLNGGIQSGNFCYCFAPYYGDRCQYGGNSSAVVRNKRAIDDIIHDIFDEVKNLGSKDSLSTTGLPVINASTTASPSNNSNQCLNGGVQFGSFCYCLAPYYGDRCQYGGNSTVLPSTTGFQTTTRNISFSTTSYPIFNASTTAPPSNNSNQCLNGGIQSGNFCYCLAPYYGDRCQYGGNSTVLPSTTGFQTTTTNIPISTTSSSIFNASTTAPPSDNLTKCMNGGIQVENFCYCRAPYNGDRCQYDGSMPIRRVRSIDNRNHRAL